MIKSVRVVTMQARGPAPDSIRLDENTSIKIVIAYDSAATGRRAEAIYERLAKRLGDNFDFEQRLWRFDVLEEESVRAEAARDAANADIVIVATNQEQKLPEGVQSWLESSLGQNGGAAALVALLDSPAPNASGVQPYLEDVARRSGLDFFAQTGDESQLPLFGPAEDETPRWLDNN